MRELATGTAPRDARLLRAMRFIEANLGEPLDGPGIARVAGLSQFHFLRLFQQETGETAGDFVRRSRLEAAAMRLAWTSDPIIGIANDFGYSGQASFTRAFSLHYGVTPAQYRRAVEAADAITADDGTKRRIRVRGIESYRCVARRYTGGLADIDANWRHFHAELPAELKHDSCFHIGVLHGDPLARGSDDIRYDCAQLLAPSAGPLPPIAIERGFEEIRTPAGLYASVCHNGRYGESVGDTYRAILGQWRPNQRRFGLGEGAALEIYRTPPLPMDMSRTEFEVAVPVYAGAT